MLKHRGFPGRLPGIDFQFTIRRANQKEGATKIIQRERFQDRKHVDRLADQGFMAALWQQFGEEPFERGNLDAGRLSWLFGREVVPAEDPFDPASYDALLQIDVKRAEAAFPRGLRAQGPGPGLSTGTRTRIRHESAQATRHSGTLSPPPFPARDLDLHRLGRARQSDLCGCWPALVGPAVATVTLSLLRGPARPRPGRTLFAVGGRMPTA